MIWRCLQMYFCKYMPWTLLQQFWRFTNKARKETPCKISTYMCLLYSWSSWYLGGIDSMDSSTLLCIHEFFTFQYCFRNSWRWLLHDLLVILKKQGIAGLDKLQWRSPLKRHQSYHYCPVVYWTSSLPITAIVYGVSNRKNMSNCIRLMLLLRYLIWNLQRNSFYIKEERWLFIVSVWSSLHLLGVVLPMDQIKGHRRKETLFLEDCFPFILEWLLNTRIWNLGQNQ